MGPDHGVHSRYTTRHVPSHLKIRVSIMICAGLVGTLYIMMLCGGSQVTGDIPFGGVTYTISIAGVKAETRFGWTGVYATLDGEGVNENGFDHGKATWFSYDEGKWGHSESDDKVKDMWKGCSRTCPLSFFSTFSGLLLSSSFFAFLVEEQSAKDNGDFAKLALRKHLWAKCVPFWATICTLCGVTVILSFGFGCYRNVTAEGAGVSKDVFEVNIGAGFIAAIIATCLSMAMMVLVFVHRSNKLREAGEGSEPCKESREEEGTQP